MIFTGDAMNPDATRPAAKLFPDARFHNIYGCTETNDSFRYELRPGDEERSALPHRRTAARRGRVGLVDDGEILTGPGAGELVVRTPFQIGRLPQPAPRRRSARTR